MPSPNHQRRAVLRGVLAAGCVLTVPMVAGCKAKESPLQAGREFTCCRRCILPPREVQRRNLQARRSTSLPLSR